MDSSGLTQGLTAGGIFTVFVLGAQFAQSWFTKRNGKQSASAIVCGLTAEDVVHIRDMRADHKEQRDEHRAIIDACSAIVRESKAQTEALKDLFKEVRDSNRVRSAP